MNTKKSTPTPEQPQRKPMHEATMQEEWTTYRDMVIPKDAPKVQIDTMKEAFFAGAYINQIKTVAIAGKYENEDEAIAVLDARRKEINLEITTQGGRRSV